MSVSTIGSYSSSISDLLNQRRQNLQTTDASTQLSDPASASQSLTIAQSDPSSLQTASGSTSPAINPYRSTLATDLTSLSSALQSGQSDQAQAALAKVQTDLTAGGTATQGTSGAHHGGHHHHGGGGGSDQTTSTSQQAANALFGSASASTSASIGADPTSVSGDVLSQLLSALDTSSPT